MGILDISKHGGKMTSRKWVHTPLPLLPFWLLWRLICGVVGFTGRLIAIVIGFVLIIVGILVSATIIGLIVGIPLILIGILLVFRGLF